MPNPTFNQSQAESGGSLTLTLSAKRIFQAVYRQQRQSAADSDEPKINVSDLISKMAFYYEKIRNSVDYREEYLLRKGAIVRILKRQMVIEGAITGQKEEDPFKIANNLLVELIRAGYLANNYLPETKIDEVAAVVARYLNLKKLALTKIISARRWLNNDLVKFNDETEARAVVTNWLIGVLASEIEDNLSYNPATDAIVKEMQRVLERSVSLPHDLPYGDDLSIQLYLSIYRNFLKLNDEDVLSFVLFKYFYADWPTADEALIHRLADNLSDLYLAVNHQINHPLKPQLDKIAGKYTVYFGILRDIMETGPEELYNDVRHDPKSFARKIKRACEHRYAVTKNRLWHSAVVRSIIYIFLTKSVFVLLLEIPATKFFGEQISNWSLAINVSFPALLLFCAVALTKLPSEANTDKIIKGVEEIMFEEKVRQQPLALRRPAKRGTAINAVFTVIYAATFILSFGVVVWALDKIHFSWVSIIIFLFFLAFAGFFAIRIKRGTKALVVVENKENLFTFLWSFFYVPVISTGKWLSGKFASINIFVFILDFIIEAPFKVFVAVAEEWTKYIRERRENIN